MSNKIVVPILIIVILVTSGFLWWLSPVYFLGGIESSEIHSIKINSGSTGNRFIIEDVEDIDVIVSNIQSIAMKKGKVSLGYTGYVYNLKFIDKQGTVIDDFALNSNNHIKKDPFFIVMSQIVCVLIT